MSPAPNLIPSVTFYIMAKGKPVAVNSRDVFSERNAALFGLPGAFTPACHHVHLPEIIADYRSFRESGSDLVACTAVNDVFVLDAWARSLGASDEIVFLADANGDFARSLDLLFDGRPLGLGYRSKRYAMWIKDCAIQHLAVEPDPTKADVTSAYALLGMFERWSQAGASP